MGAALALASLAGLGTARKGLGAGRTDEGQGSWADNDWYQPPQTVQDTWTWHDDYSYNPNTGFAPVVNTSPVEQQVQTGGSASGDSGGSADNQDNNNNSNNNANNSSAPVHTSSRYDREEAKQEQVAREQEIKTIEDATKKAERDAMSALERYMARHDEALDQQDRTVTNEDYAATVKRLQEAEAQLAAEN